jgi:hypothetical protein
VVVSVRRHPDAPHLYPLALELSILSPSGGTRLRRVVPAEGDEPHRIELPIPADLRPGAALDLTLVAERTTAAPSGLAARSLLLVGVDLVE